MRKTPLLLVWLLLTFSVQAQQVSGSDILVKSDEDSAKLVKEMIEVGDLSGKDRAAAWVVLSTVALGMGLEKCSFPQLPNSDFATVPALDGLGVNEITLINRMITSNFREAETPEFVELQKLYPITRQAIRYLSDDDRRWDCELILGVWTAGMNYVQNRKTEKHK